jgi:hypothetical protein
VAGGQVSLILVFPRQYLTLKGDAVKRLLPAQAVMKPPVAVATVASYCTETFGPRLYLVGVDPAQVPSQT